MKHRTTILSNSPFNSPTQTPTLTRRAAPRFAFLAPQPPHPATRNRPPTGNNCGGAVQLVHSDLPALLASVSRTVTSPFARPSLTARNGAHGNMSVRAPSSARRRRETPNVTPARGDWSRTAVPRRADAAVPALETQGALDNATNRDHRLARCGLSGDCASKPIPP